MALCARVVLSWSLPALSLLWQTVGRPSILRPVCQADRRKATRCSSVAPRAMQENRESRSHDTERKVYIARQGRRLLKEAPQKAHEGGRGAASSKLMIQMETVIPATPDQLAGGRMAGGSRSDCSVLKIMRLHASRQVDGESMAVPEVLDLRTKTLGCVSCGPQRDGVEWERSITGS